MRPNHSGFTLIETLVALSLFSIGMLGTARLVTVLLHGNMLSYTLTTATHLAQEKLEEIRNTPYTAITPAEETVVAATTTRYTRTTTVHTEQPAAGMTTVAITVRWHTPPLRQRSIMLSTIVAESP